MNLLFDIVIRQGFVLDLFGILGLGLVAFGALRLARRIPGPAAALMSWGALGLIAGRVGMLVLLEIILPSAHLSFDPTWISLAQNISVALLTGGLGAIVYGFWSHERELAAERGIA